MSDIDELLAERGKQHGNFEKVAHTAQVLKSVLRAASVDGNSTMQQREAMEMIALKLARIANGDAMHKDHWTDIAGYARLVEQTL